MSRLFVNWILGIVAVVLTIWLAEKVGLEMFWPEKWKIVIFIPILAAANGILRPILKLLTVPISCMTFGLFGLVINAFVFWLAASMTGARLTLWSAMFGSVCTAVMSGLLSWMFTQKDAKE